MKTKNRFGAVLGAPKEAPPRDMNARCTMKATKKRDWLADLEGRKPELMALDAEHLVAYLTANLIRSGKRKEAGVVLGTICDSPRMLHLVAEAREGKRWKHGVTDTGLNIIKAWYAAACERGAWTNDCFNLDAAPPTMCEIKTQYARLFAAKEKPPENPAEIRGWLADLEGRKKIPRDWTFRITLNRCELRYLQDQRGAPRK